MKIIGKVFIVSWVVFLAFALYLMYQKNQKDKTGVYLKQINDNLMVRLKQKDSVLNLKEIEFKELKQSDSIKINLINNSIKSLKYEIKKQSNQVYSTPDSLFQQYIDSIRTARGFYKIQYNGK